MRGPARRPGVDQPVVLAVDDQARRGDPGHVPPGRMAALTEELRAEGAGAAHQGGDGILERVPAAQFGHFGGEPGLRVEAGVAVAGGDDRGHPAFRRQGGLVLPDQPGSEPRQPDDGEAHQVQPGTQVGEGRGDQREGFDEVGPGGGDLDADRAAQRVADEVHRFGLLLYERGDALGQGGDRVAAVRAGRRVAEPGQVHRLAGEPVPEQVDKVGPVTARTLQAVHEQRGFGAVFRDRGAAHEDLVVAGPVVADTDQAAGPVRDRLGSCCHALARRRLLGLALDLVSSASSSVPSSDLPRPPPLAAATLARRISVRSAGCFLASGRSRPSGRTISLPSILAWTTASSASRYASLYWSGSKSSVIVSMSEAAIFSSCDRTSMSSSRKAKSGLRTSSGHSRVSSVMTPSLTRSAASASRWRSATLATATLPEASRASRNSTYARAPACSGSVK